MKKLLFFFTLLIGFASQAQVKVLGYIVPNAPTDNYPTHIDTYGAGGYMTMKRISQRDSIPALRRREGMLVFVADSGRAYQLNADLVTWKSPSLGGGPNGTGEIDPVFLAHVAHTITQNDINFWNRIALLPFYSTTDSMLSKIDSATRAHDYTFNPVYFTVNNRFVSFNPLAFNDIEQDPVFMGHVASSISQADIDRWNATANIDLSNYFTKDETTTAISDSLRKYIYYFDGKTIVGTGKTPQDPFRVIPYGDTSLYKILTNSYTKQQVDSAIAANFHEYGAGYGLILQNSTFILDTSLIATRRFVDSAAASIVNRFGDSIANIRNDFGDSLTNIRNVFGDSLTTIRNDFGDSLATIHNQITNITNNGGGSGSRSVTSVSATGAGGVIASVTNPTTTPAISIRADTSVLATRNYVTNIIRTGGDTTINNNSGDTTINNGDSLQIGNNQPWFIVNPSTTLVTLIIKLPTAPIQGQEVKISFGGIIRSGNVVNAVTIRPNTGQTILQATTPTSVEAGEYVSYKYNSANKTYYRL